MSCIKASTSKLQTLSALTFSLGHGFPAHGQSIRRNMSMRARGKQREVLQSAPSLTRRRTLHTTPPKNFWGFFRRSPQPCRTAFFDGQPRRREQRLWEAVENGVKAAERAVANGEAAGGVGGGMMMRCTVLDVNGNVKVISGQFKKTELCVQHSLQPRDLRKIDSKVPNVVPTILVRKECILVNMLHIRALLKHDSIYLFDSYGSKDTTIQSLFLYNLGHNLRLGAKASGGLPYEFRALEAIFASVVQALESELVDLRVVIVELLEALAVDIDREKLKLLLHYSRQLSVFHKVAKLVQDSFDECLEQDEDLAAMYLTEKATYQRPRDSDDHEEVELLFESFSNQVEEMVSEAENLLANVKSTEEIADLILDSNRNQLLSLDLKVSIGTMGVGTGALIASMFGMNLRSGMEEHAFAFYIASFGAVSLSALISVYGIRKLRKLRKVGIGIGVARMGIQEREHSGVVPRLGIGTRFGFEDALEERKQNASALKNNKTTFGRGRGQK